MRKRAFWVLACVLLTCPRVVKAAENEQTMRTEPFEMFCKVHEGESERVYCLHSIASEIDGATDIDSAHPRDLVEVFCSEASNTFERPVCIHVKLSSPPCAGTMEERLTCLDDRLATAEWKIDG